jgi:hypothetical protein
MKSIALAAIMLAAPAVAQEERCGDYATIAANLAKMFNEQRVASGLDDKGNVIAVFASKNGETWTVLRVQPTGPACVVSDGTSWEAQPAGEPA